MSYEGTIWYLCERGHLSREDALSEMHDGSEFNGKCFHCTSKLVSCFNQDETNGYIEEEPSTHRPLLTQFDFDDVPSMDHRGNHYVRMLPKYVVQRNSQQKWTRL